MVKIKISYNTDKELAKVIQLLAPILKKCKVSKNKEGNFKKAYIDVNDNI